jgi:hypothetical protein
MFVAERSWWGARFADGAHLLPSYGNVPLSKVATPVITKMPSTWTMSHEAIDRRWKTFKRANTIVWEAFPSVP